MNKRTEKMIREIYSKVFNKVYSKSAIRELQKGNRSSIIKIASILQSSPDYEKFAIKYAKELAKLGITYQVGQWRKYYEAARKLHFVSLKPTFHEFEQEQLSKIVKQNFEMIKTIPQATVKVMEHKYASTLIEEVQKGNLSRGAFERQLKSHGAKNARVIARTESAKLQTAIVENRAADLGSVVYRWRSSNDKRTRPSHKEMNDVIVFWRKQDEKPLRDNMRGNAGEFPNCRCSPQPIFSRDDLTESTYKVYNYHTDKIESMSRRDLVEAMQRGRL